MKFKLILGSILAAVLLLVGGVAYASIPGPDGVIHGCLASSGKILIIDSSASCASGTTALNWNQTGPAGADGTDGTNAVAGAHMIASTGVLVSGNGADINVHCPTGEIAISGGYQLSVPDASVPNVHIVGSYNGGSLTALNGDWILNYQSLIDHNVTDGITIFAICAEVN